MPESTAATASRSQVSLCRAECPDGTFGVGCRRRCRCDNGARCDHVGGACTCAAGWRGVACDRPCPRGYYGDECRRSCRCGRRRRCHPLTGLCVCPRGFAGLNCTDACPAGSWGHDCSQVTFKLCYLRLPHRAHPPPISVRCTVTSVSVCLYVCLSAGVPQKHVQTSRNYLYMLPVAVAESFSDDSAVYFLLPVCG